MSDTKTEALQIAHAALDRASKWLQGEYAKAPESEGAKVQIAVNDALAEVSRVLRLHHAPPKVEVHFGPPLNDTHALMGRQVVVKLGTDDGVPVVARGKLLAHNEWGEVVLQDDMGGLQFCWPNLDIALDHDPSEQGDWP